MKYKIFKIKQGKRERWISWCRTLSGPRLSEAEKTMREEGNSRETIILAGDHLLYGIEGKRLPSSDCALNKEHRRVFIECLDAVTPEGFAADAGFEVILDIKTENHVHA